MSCQRRQTPCCSPSTKSPSWSRSPFSRHQIQCPANLPSVDGYDDGTAALGADELIAWSRDTMAAYKYPRTVEFVDALPMTATGKVLKRELRAAPVAGSPKSPPS